MNIPFKPLEQIRYHIQHKQRSQNPTYNSVFMTSSLNNFVANPYSQTLMKQTQYKKNFDKLDGTLASYQSMLKSMGKSSEGIFKDMNKSINFTMNRTIFSQSGTNSLSSSQSSNNN